MKCTTVRVDTPYAECPFMGKRGCTYNGGSCSPIVEQCNGCNKTLECNTASYCVVVPDPARKWATGVCNFASHITRERAIETVTKLNPLKASKRGIR